MYYFIDWCKGKDIFAISEETYFSLIIACSGHDVDHPGHNNLFEIKNWSVLATIYNDKSVLENHHVATLFKIASNWEAGIFDDLTKD